MDKTSLITEITRHLTEELATVQNAANEAHRTATHEESVAENKYDTFGLEAAYLAEGLSRRVEDIQAAIQTIRSPSLVLPRTEVVTLGSMVRLEEIESTEVAVFFISPVAGGLRVPFEGGECRVITPATPIGMQLMDKTIGDEVQISLAGKLCTFEIVDLG